MLKQVFKLSCCPHKFLTDGLQVDPLKKDSNSRWKFLMGIAKRCFFSLMELRDLTRKMIMAEILPYSLQSSYLISKAKKVKLLFMR